MVVVGVLLAVLATVGTTMGVLEDPIGERAWVGSATSLLVLLSFLTASTVLFARRPDHAVSWVVSAPLLYFLADPIREVVDPILSPSAVVWADWVNQVLFVAVAFAVVYLPLLFPTGHLPSRGWRWVAVTGAVTLVLLGVRTAIAPDLLAPEPNPAEVGGPWADLLFVPGAVLLAVSFIASAVSAVVRARRSVGLERLQLRWFARGAAVLPIAWLIAVATESTPYSQMGGLALGIGLAVLPVSVAFAVLRYRLFDIDRIVSRVVTYAVVTITLVLAYLGLVLFATAVLSSRGDPPDAVVAAATLFVAAAFRPLRRSTQALVDRRFNRTRHDHEVLVREFRDRLRDQVATDDLESGLLEAVRGALAPAHVSLWLSLPPSADPTRRAGVA